MMTDDASLDDAAGLTRHIEARYHQRHRAQLPRVAEMAAKVETVHFGNEALPKGLSDLLRRMIGEMEVHMKKEELILFPAIRAGGEPGIEIRSRSCAPTMTITNGRSAKSAG